MTGIILDHNPILIDSVTPSNFFCEAATEIDNSLNGLAFKVKELSQLPINTQEQAQLLNAFYDAINHPIDDWINEFVGEPEKQAIYSVLRLHGLNDVVDLYEFIFYVCDKITLSLDEYELQHTLLIPYKPDLECGDQDDQHQKLNLNHIVLGCMFTGQYRAF